MLISVRIEGTQPLTGTVATKGREPLRFDGWLELLRALAELVAAAPPDGEDSDAAAEPARGAERTDAGGPPEPPASR